MIAGWLQNDLHFNPRVGCIPCAELEAMIFSFIEEEVERILKKNDEDGKTRITAVTVLRFWASLRRVILQDAAAMFVLHPERVDHPLFRLPVFRHPLFSVSRRHVVEMGFLIFAFTNTFNSTYTTGVRHRDAGVSR